ncbi:hypothetical protein MMC32_002714 [Xylographa parallela]|nr:hypothetical protein [Xylographa parallela]
MAYHYDSVNFGGYELPAWDVQEDSVPDTIDPAWLLASPAAGFYDVQEAGEVAE